MMCRRTRRRVWRIRRQTVQQVVCLLTGVSLVLQQTGVGYAYCGSNLITGPCAGNPSSCCAVTAGPLLDTASGSCSSGSCGGSQSSSEVAVTRDPIELLRGSLAEQATDIAVSGPTFSWCVGECAERVKLWECREVYGEGVGWRDMELRLPASALWSRVKKVCWQGSTEIH